MASRPTKEGLEFANPAQRNPPDRGYPLVPSFNKVGHLELDMPLYVTEHTHPADRCPAKDPRMAQGLLALISGAGKAGIQIRGDAVTNGQHHLYIIAEADGPEVLRKHFAPFGQMGTLTVTPASHCEEVVARGVC